MTNKKFMDNLHNYAVYFNGEYIGEATRFRVTRGDNICMPQLIIRGAYQAKK